jgi:hypothetical protein
MGIKYVLNRKELVKSNKMLYDVRCNIRIGLILR